MKLYIHSDPHQYIQGYLVKAFSLLSPEVFKLQVNMIPIFAYSFQGLSHGSIRYLLRPMQQLTLTKHNFEPLIWLIKEKKIWFSQIFFNCLSLFWCLFWTIKRYLKTLVLKRIYSLKKKLFSNDHDIEFIDTIRFILVAISANL